MQSLDPKACQSLLSKFKIKDNGLQQALASYDKLGEDDHDQRLKAIGNVSQLANTLKRSKEAAAAPQVVKYLSDLASAADTEKNGVTKLKLRPKKPRRRPPRLRLRPTRPSSRRTRPGRPGQRGRKRSGRSRGRWNG